MIIHNNTESFGQKLKNIREKAGLNIDQLSIITKIQKEILEALENEKFDKTPGPVFNKGFIRSICKILKIDPAELLYLYNKTTKNEQNYEAQNLKLCIKTKSQKSNTIKNYFSQITKSFLLIISIFIKQYKIILNKYKTTKSLIITSLISIIIILLALIISLISKNYLDIQHLNTLNPTQNLYSTKEFENSLNNNNSQINNNINNSSQPHQIRDKTDNTTVYNAPKPQNIDTNLTVNYPNTYHDNLKLNDNKEQLLTIKVKAPVKIKLKIDNDKDWKIQDLKAQIYNFKFNTVLHIMIYDASRTDVYFNNDFLGPLGNPGRIRRLTFMTHNPEPTKKQISN